MLRARANLSEEISTEILRSGQQMIARQLLQKLFIVLILSSEHIPPLLCCCTSCYDETLPIINKPKHPKKGENKEKNGRTHVHEDKRTT
jgi:hypothetical protein